MLDGGEDGDASRQIVLYTTSMRPLPPRIALACCGLLIALLLAEAALRLTTPPTFLQEKLTALGWLN